MLGRERKLLEAAEALINHTDYHNKNLTKKQEFLLDDLKLAVSAYSRGYKAVYGKKGGTA